MNIETVIVWYVILLNLFTFMLMGIDKKRAINHKWRISEKTLFVTAIFGGAIGAICGMRFFKHKTKHRSFKVGMPLILLIQVIVLFLFS